MEVTREKKEDYLFAEFQNFEVRALSLGLLDGEAGMTQMLSYIKWLNMHILTLPYSIQCLMGSDKAVLNLVCDSESEIDGEPRNQVPEEGLLK